MRPIRPGYVRGCPRASRPRWLNQGRGSIQLLQGPACSLGGASSAPLASRDGTPANRRLPLRPPCGEGVSACDAKGFAALPFGTDGRRTPGHAAPRHVGSRLALDGITPQRSRRSLAATLRSREGGRARREGCSSTWSGQGGSTMKRAPWVRYGDAPGRLGLARTPITFGICHA